MINYKPILLNRVIQKTHCISVQCVFYNLTIILSMHILMKEKKGEKL